MPMPINRYEDHPFVLDYRLTDEKTPYEVWRVFPQELEENPDMTLECVYETDIDLDDEMALAEAIAFAESEMPTGACVLVVHGRIDPWEVYPLGHWYPRYK